MRRTYRRKKYKPDKTQFRANERIRIPEVRVLDQLGKMIGVMPTAKALAMARELGFDLVEVDPTSQPPIAKFMDFGRMQYEREKIKQKAKSKLKKIETKGIRLSFRISDHDKDVRLKQAIKFMEKGNKVKVEMTVRGRENAYLKQALEKTREFLKEITEGLKVETIIEKQPKKEGGKITTVIATKN